MAAYYNEIEPFAADWIRNLIARGLIAPGDVDTRSIIDVRPDDLRGYTQCHFFAGIGGWSYALRSAGWDDARPVWTGSCPCQPFSLAGKQKGFDDARHLWPVWRELIRERDPSVVFGEQVASAGKWPGDLQRMRDREAIERVLQGQSFGNGPALDLQGLLEGAGGDEEGEAWGEGQDQRVTSGISQAQPSLLPLHAGEVSGQEEGHFLRSGATHSGSAEDHRSGSLPIDERAVQSGWREDVGQPLTGSDRLQQGLYAAERSRRTLLRERDGEPLGAEQDHRDSPGDQDAEVVSVGRSAGKAGSVAPDEANWLGLVRSDLEAMGRAVGAMPIQAASAGADHLRDRYWFVAHTDSKRRQIYQDARGGAEGSASWPIPGSRSLGDVGMADSDQFGAGAERAERSGQLGGTSGDPEARDGELANAGGTRVRGRGPEEDVGQAGTRKGEGKEWQRVRADARDVGDGRHEWVIGADGKARRVKPGIRLLAHGVPNRVGTLRGFGNAIDPRPAAAFIEAADYAMRGLALCSKNHSTGDV